VNSQPPPCQKKHLWKQRETNQPTPSGNETPTDCGTEQRASVLTHHERNTMYYRASSFLLAAAMSASTYCAAQFNSFAGDLDSNNPFHQLPTISGTINSINGTPLHDIRIEVRAMGTGSVIETCFSSANGTFEARNLRPGTYEVVAIDGMSETSEHVTLQGGMASVNLRMGGGGSGSSSPKIGTVSVVELKTPEKARHLTQKAHEAFRKNHREEAQKDVEQALAIAPDYPDALTTRAVLRMSSNQPQAAIEDLDHAVKVDPSYGPAYLVLGAVFNQMGRYDEALRSLDRGSMYDPKSWQCAFESSKAWLGKREYTRAVEQLNRAEKLTVRSMMAPIHLLRGYALMGEKHFEQASTDLEAYLTAEPNGELAGSARAALAKVKTLMVEKPDTLVLPAMTGVFASAAH
jgi:Tfp pilus assembly protein PilF